MSLTRTPRDAAPPNLTHTKKKGSPFLARSLREKWETRISTSDAISLLKQDEPRTLLEIQPPTLEKAKGGAASVVSHLKFQIERVGHPPP